MKLLIIGPIKGPKGGINVHLNRLIYFLEEDSDIEVLRINDGKGVLADWPNIRRLQFISCARLLLKSNIVHIHTSVWWMIMLYTIASLIFKKRIFITIHSWGYTPFQKRLVRKVINRADKIILVSNEISAEIGKMDAKVFVKHAFLPPVNNDEKFLPASLESKILVKREEGCRIFVANAWQLFMYNHEDLYGLDMCIELARRFKESSLEAYIIFVVSSPNDIYYRYSSTIETEDLSSFIYVHKGEVSFCNLIKQADVVLRPTNKDGDALTVREGLFYQKIVLASDVVRRPQGTLTFKTRSCDDLFEKAAELVRKNPSTGSLSTQSSKEELVEWYLKFYEVYSVD